MSSIEYQLPPLPLGGSRATIIRWLKQPGDRLAPGDPLLIVVTDRAETAIPAAHAGLLEALLVGAGVDVDIGASIARIVPAPDVPGQARSARPAAEIPPRRVSPVAGRIAAIKHIDLTDLHGTGPAGRIMKRDVLAEIESLGESVVGGPLSVAADHGLRTTDYGPRTTDETRYISPSSMRRAIAEHMLRSRATSPHALTAMEADMGQVAAVRARWRADFARRAADLTYTACIALAAIEALLCHPLLNSSWSDAGIILRRRVHLGVAVALPDGLITPVIREAQDLNLRGVARAVADVARRARAGALRPGEASGGTFTITNPGAGSLWLGTPIIPQPQCAILGVGAVRPRPLVVTAGGGDRVVVRPAALLTLSYDARVLDQCHADGFLADVKSRLEHFQDARGAL